MTEKEALNNVIKKITMAKCETLSPLELLAIKLAFAAGARYAYQDTREYMESFPAVNND